MLCTRRISYCICSACVFDRRTAEYLDYLRDHGIDPDKDPVIQAQYTITTGNQRVRAGGPTRTTKPSDPRVGVKNYSA